MAFREVLSNAIEQISTCWRGSRRSPKRAARKKECSNVSSFPWVHRQKCGCRSRSSEREVVWEHVYNDELTARTWALNSAVECHLHTSSRSNTFNNLTRLSGTAKYLKIPGG